MRPRPPVAAIVERLSRGSTVSSFRPSTSAAAETTVRVRSGRSAACDSAPMTNTTAAAPTCGQSPAQYPEAKTAADPTNSRSEGGAVGSVTSGMCGKPWAKRWAPISHSVGSAWSRHLPYGSGAVIAFRVQRARVWILAGRTWGRRFATAVAVRGRSVRSQPALRSDNSVRAQEFHDQVETLLWPLEVQEMRRSRYEIVIDSG